MLKHFFRLGCAAMILLVSACAHYEPFDPTPVADIPEGPGLFSGEDGEWVLYRKE